ncbi:MAG: DNA-binding response regulator, partial [Alphaproteobacteria bacterium]|nr:DNA-binding response regulator [Alphaproteobacteria bacterium]
PREREVLECLLSGLPNKLIGDKLGISPRTVEVHRARLMLKTQAKSLAHLIQLAFQAGLLPENGET